MPSRRIPRPPRALVAALAVVAPSLVALPAARAQRLPTTVERAAPFDSAGRILVVTPALATRLALGAPDWPVAGPFAEARLYAVEGDGAVLAVVRPSGAIERFALTAAERASIVAAVTRAVVASSRAIRSDTNTIVSEPAGNTFVASQVGLGLTLYGISLATLFSEDPAGAGVAYAVGLGASFGASLGYARSHTVTRAQTRLSTHMAHGLAAGAAALVSIADPEEDRVYAGAVLAGSITGTVIGLRRGAGLTDAEATSSGAAALLGVGATAGLLAGLGAFDDDGGRRVATGVSVAALAAGYAVGPAYARQRAYAVTAGDARLLLPSALAGSAVGAGIGFAASRDDRPRALAATLGFVAGALVGDRGLVRPFDFTAAESALATLGGTVGAGVGAALAGAAEASEAGTLTLVGVGAAAGLMMTSGVVRPTRATGARLRLFPAPGGALRERPARLQLSPVGAALAATGLRGRFPIASGTF